MTFLIPLLIVTTISILGLTGGILLIYKETLAKLISKYLVNFAIGALIAVVFLDLLPEAIELSTTPKSILIFPLAGILIFYLLEKTLLWHHHHQEEQVWHEKHTPEEKVHPVGYLITAGDGLHNFIDGVVIAASFLIDFRLGIVTSLTVLAHELPQEIGEFAILLHAGFAKVKVIFLSLAAQSTAIFGFIVGFFFLPLFENLEAKLLAFAAGGFIYIAAADLLPETHRETQLSKSVLQIFLLILGVLIIWTIRAVFPE